MLWNSKLNTGFHVINITKSILNKYLLLKNIFSGQNRESLIGQNYNQMKLAVVGATGLVGSEILEVLEEHNFPFDELLLVASERSAGKRLLIRVRSIR